MDHLVEAFSVLFVVIGPIDNAAAFAAFTKGYEPARRRRTALKSIVVATIVMMIFAVFGDDILHLIGVTLSSLQIAGGILLLLAAIQMVTAEPPHMKSVKEHPPKDIAVFPMAMPLIAGPDAIVAVVMLISKATAPSPTRSVLMMSQIGVILVMLFVLLLTYLALLGAGRLVKLLGTEGIDVVTRILGLLLAALAVEFIVEGLVISHLFAGN